MKKQIIEILAVLALVLLPSLAWAQAKVYTKKARMADFPTSTTKVVLSGESLLDMAFRDVVVSRWNVSPYEFCTPDEYRALKTSNSYYFLSLAQDEGVVFVVLEKGGAEGEQNMLKIPFEVVRVPVAAQGAITGLEFGFLGAFLDIVQQFATESMNSDRVGYTGIGTYNGKDLRGMRIILDLEQSGQALDDAEPNTLSAIVIAPLEVSFKTWCYKMLINSETHELYYYTRARFNSPSDAKFSDKELKLFDKKHATVVR